MVRLATRAMACDFAVFTNPGPADRVAASSEALDLVHALEDQMSVYRAHTELSQLNRRAAEEPVEVEPRLYALLRQAERLCRAAEGCFDPTAGPLVALWRRCRQENRVPSDEEIADELEFTGIDHVVFDDAARTVRFDRRGIELNLGGIGKGYALDRAGELLVEQGVEDWLLHGGHSSLLARGDHNAQGGWPVGVRNPLFPRRRLATLLLRDCAMASSGSSEQFFRHGGRRYGHILDPRTGRPVEGMLAVTVLAPTAAEADALATAFFVMGLENARAYCHNDGRIGALLIPPPRRGRRLEPAVCNIPDEALYFTPEESISVEHPSAPEG